MGISSTKGQEVLELWRINNNRHFKWKESLNSRESRFDQRRVV